jgi:hypothetical protein
MPNRAPGGVLGHRNSAAHLMVLATPVLALLAVRAQRRRELLPVCAALAMAVAVVVLSRSRGAWLAAMVTGASVLAAAVRAVGWRTLATRRAGLVLGAALFGALAAAALPNRLDWREDGGETLRHLADYESGSGHGRVVQYLQTLKMVGDHPLLGVGPGRWTLTYPQYAIAGDPSFDPAALVPTNRLPQSDWTGLAAERGLPALLLLVLAGLAMARRCTRALRGDMARASTKRPTDGGRAPGLAALGVLVAAAVLGTFDPILLQPLPSFFILLVLGALVPSGPPRVQVSLRPALRPALAGLLLLLAAAPLAVSTRQIWAATLLVRGRGPEALARAVRANPGDYRLQAMLAGHLVSQRRCDLALPHIRAAQLLFPTAPAPRSLRQACRRSVPDAAPEAGEPATLVPPLAVDGRP